MATISPSGVMKTCWVAVLAMHLSLGELQGQARNPTGATTFATATCLDCMSLQVTRDGGSASSDLRSAAAGEMGWQAHRFQETKEENGGLFSWKTIVTVSLGGGLGYAAGCEHWGFDGGEGDEATGVPCGTEATLVGVGTFLTMTVVRLLTDDKEDTEVRRLAAVLRPSILPGAMEIGLRLPITLYLPN